MAEIEEIYKDFLKMIEIPAERVDGYRVAKTLSGAIVYEDGYGNCINPTMGLYKLLLKRRGFLNKPIIISDEDYKKYKSTEIYHGFKERKHGKDFLIGSGYHLGTGNAMGTYFSGDKNEAMEYTGEKDKKSMDRVLVSKLAPVKSEKLTDILQFLNVARGYQSRVSINNPEYNLKINELVDFCSDKDDDNQKFSFFIYMTNTAQMMAVYLSIDSLSMEVGDKSHVVLLNRSKLVVSDENASGFTCETEKI